MNNCYLFQPQYGSEFNGQEQYWLPYSVGVLWAYAAQFQDITDNWRLGGLYFKRSPIASVLEELEDPKLCGFSNYVWNKNYCFKLAKAIKERWPNCKIVFGGPSVTEKYLDEDFIDTIVMKEGEISFVEILRNIDSLKRCYNSTRIADLTDLPSPYSTGVFDKLIARNPDYSWNATLETNRGCPYSCTFCDWGGLTANKVKTYPLDKVYNEIDWFKANPIKTIFLTDANFGIFKQRDLEIAKKISTLINNSAVEYVAMNYAKNSNELVFDIQKLINDITYRGITLTVQSMNDETLEAIKRKNMAVNDLKHLLELSKQHDIPNYTEVILGLPKETKETWINGVCKLLELGQHNYIFLQLAQIIENTELADVQVEQYDIKTVRVKSAFRHNNISNSEDIAEYSDIVCSTRDITREEIIECYMFNWLIHHFHINGYSQLLSKYCRNVLDVPYREFYETLKEKMHLFTSLQSEYEFMQKEITNFYTNGWIEDDNLRQQNPFAYSVFNIYNNYQDAINLAIETAKTFGNIDESIIEIQKRFLSNSVWGPTQIKTDYNIDTWNNEQTTYDITYTETDKSKFIFNRGYFARSIITKID